MQRQNGFTLIELITVIVLLGSLAAIGGIFIVQPFQAVDDMRRRAELVDEAQLIIERMAREIRTALPNSVRTGASGTRTTLELVSTRTGGRYRRLPAPGGGGDRLNRTQSNDTFDALGGLIDIGGWFMGDNLGLANALRFRSLERRSFKDPTTKAYTLAYFEDPDGNVMYVVEERGAHR